MKPFLLLTLMTILALTACKKNSIDSGPADIKGAWIGVWRNESSSVEYKMTVLFRESGSARILYGYTVDTASAHYKLEGSYNYAGGTVKFSYKEGSNSFTHSGKVTDKNMTGTWGRSPNDKDGGTWDLTANY